jgi:hypothetical protein
MCAGVNGKMTENSDCGLFRSEFGTNCLAALPSRHLNAFNLAMLKNPALSLDAQLA